MYNQGIFVKTKKLALAHLFSHSVVSDSATSWTVCSLLSSSVHGISWVSILEWVATSFSKGSSQHKDRTCICFTGRWILHLWATREAVGYSKWCIFLCVMYYAMTTIPILNSLHMFFLKMIFKKLGLLMCHLHTVRFSQFSLPFYRF